VTARLVVLVSGSGTNLQALLDAAEEESYGAEVVAVGADRDGIAGLERARRHNVPAFVHRVKDYPNREDWDRELTASVVGYRPDLVVSAGFLKLVGPAFLAAFGDRYINTHNALLPAFPGIHGPRDALAYGVRLAGRDAVLRGRGASIPGRSSRRWRCRYSTGTPRRASPSASRTPSGVNWSRRSAGWCARVGP